MSYRRHLDNCKQLETTYEEVRAGFVALALERNRRATPYVEEARSLKVLASAASTAKSLSQIIQIQAALLTAAGVSDKAAKHLNESDKTEAINGLIANFLEPAGSNFVEELVFRFLLTKGDSLGGSMRNIGGTLAQRKLSRSIISSLTLAKIPVRALLSTNNTWIDVTHTNDADIEIYLRGLSWSNTYGQRTLIYNLTVPQVKNNIDLCLLNCRPNELDKVRAPADATTYIAFGELKGGIDPAGADEHWKTAKTALDRIRQAFIRKKLSPKTFFVAAAIASKMATEIWDDLEAGTLTNASNLTAPNQVASLCLWLISL